MEWNVPDTFFARVSKLLTSFAVTTNTIAFVIVGAMFSPPLAMAGEPYVGAGVGYSIANPHYVEFDADGAITSLGGPVTGKAYRFFAGYSFSNYVALEGGWFKADDLHGTIGPFLIADVQTIFGGKRRITVSGGSLDLIGTLPISKQFSVLARVGVLASKVADGSYYVSSYDTAFIGSPGVPSAVANNSYYKFQTIPRRANTLEYGLGLKYNVSSSWSIESEWRRVNMGIYRMGYLDVLDVAVIFNF
jgi:opacity protein-like surface antigen